MTEHTPETLLAQLAAPFDVPDLGWKIQVTGRGDNVMIAPYVDARAVMRRLSMVLGRAGWETRMDAIQGGMSCALTVRLPGSPPITRTDVANWPGDATATTTRTYQEKDRRTGEVRDVQRVTVGSGSDTGVKGAASDALKRAAVQFGIGAYLYELPKLWYPKSKLQRERFLPYEGSPEWHEFTASMWKKFPAWAKPETEAPREAAPADSSPPSTARPQDRPQRQREKRPQQPAADPVDDILARMADGQITPSEAFRQAHKAGISFNSSGWKQIQQAADSGQGGRR